MGCFSYYGGGGRGGGVTSKEGLIVPRFQGHLKENSDLDSLCSTAEGTLGHESQPTLALPIGRVEVMSSLLEAHLVDGSLPSPFLFFSYKIEKKKTLMEFLVNHWRLQ